MRRLWIGVLVVGVAIGAAWAWRVVHRPAYEAAYAGERKVILYSSTAQVRQVVGSLRFGDRVDVLTRAGANVEVRAPNGVSGWVDQRQLLGPELWQRIGVLGDRAKTMTGQAFGHTKVPTNLHIEPGRATQVYFQFGRNVPVDLLERSVAENASASSGENSGEPSGPKKEDWWLVRAQVPELGEIAGWVLGRFVELDLPDPLPSYTSSAGMRVVGWFVLNQVNDPSGLKSQYLVMGSRGGDGQACDFTMLRVYTWGAKRQRYETAFVDSSTCGMLPVSVTPATQPGGDAEFSFIERTPSGRQRVSFQMHQTSVRRIREGEPLRRRPGRKK